MEGINKDKTVLIVDDEQAIIDVLKFNLVKEGYKIRSKRWSNRFGYGT